LCVVSSLLGTAISYAFGQWAGMTVYLEDGRVEIDNNLVENAIRPTALGKNYAEIRIMPSTAAELVMNGLDCSIDGWLRKGGVCAISLWVFAKHHDSKTIPSPLRSTSDGRQPSGHNPGAVAFVSGWILKVKVAVIVGVCASVEKAPSAGPKP